MRADNRVLALREGVFASLEETQRAIAEDWGACVSMGIAVLSVTGPTRMSYWGAGTYSALRARIEQCLDSEEVSLIVLEMNSPGGDVNGLFECCEYISKAKETKPIHAHVTGMCCSAAYAIAASCTDISATQTSEIGSVGVYAQAYDDSEYLKKQGILSRIFRSRNAERKNLSAFSEEGGKDIQDKIDFYENCFYTVLSEGRGMDRGKCVEDFGHGAVFLASDALERNMIDSVVAYDELIDSLTSSDEDEEDEGEDMDIAQMTAEQKAELFRALVQDSPALLAEAQESARTAERGRLTALYAERDEGNAGIIDRAVAEGASLEAISLELYKAEKERKAKLGVIATQAENEQTITGLAATTPDDLGAQASKVADRVAAARKTGGEK